MIDPKRSYIPPWTGRTHISASDNLPSKSQNRPKSDKKWSQSHHFVNLFSRGTWRRWGWLARRRWSATRESARRRPSETRRSRRPSPRRSEWRRGKSVWIVIKIIFRCKQIIIWSLTDHNWSLLWSSILITEYPVKVAQRRRDRQEQEGLWAQEGRLRRRGSDQGEF